MNPHRHQNENESKETGRDLLTIDEAADLLRAPVATLRYGPRSFRVGRGVRYWRHEILEWLHEQSDCDGSHAA